MEVLLGFFSEHGPIRKYFPIQIRVANLGAFQVVIRFTQKALALSNDRGLHLET